MNFVLALIFATAMWIGTVVYVGRMVQRENFPMRLIVCVGGFYALAAAFIALFSKNLMGLSVLFRIIGMPILVVFIYGCWNISVSLCLYYAMWAFMSWQLMSELWIGIIMIIQPFTEIGLKWLALIGLLIFSVGNLMIGFTIARWMSEDGKEKIGI